MDRDKLQWLGCHMGFPLTLAIVPVVHVFVLTQLELNQSLFGLSLMLSLLLWMATLERLRRYPQASEQSGVAARNWFWGAFNLLVTTTLMALTFKPLLTMSTRVLVGRERWIMDSTDLGPLWLQMLGLVVAVDLSRYWVHRLQHTSKFLWRFHQMHHTVTDLRSANTFLSHPVDYAIRISTFFFIPVVIGFDARAVAFTVGFTGMLAVFSHCGADLRHGVLNKFIATNQVHRWHHALDVPDGQQSVNYGVALVIWDHVFGTYYFPDEASNPKGMGNPDDAREVIGVWDFLLAPFRARPAGTAAGAVTTER